MKLLFFLLILATLPALAFSDPLKAFSEITSGQAIIIDVREKDEVIQGMIKRALWFPLSKIEQDETWKKEFTKMTEGKKIYLYCKSGKRAERVRNLLQRNGISAYNLGGYEDLAKTKLGRK